MSKAINLESNTSLRYFLRERETNDFAFNNFTNIEAGQVKAIYRKGYKQGERNYESVMRVKMKIAGLPDDLIESIFQTSTPFKVIEESQKAFVNNEFI